MDLGSRTRLIHATDEARDLTWEGEAGMAIAAKFTPQIAPDEELKKRAVHALLRNLARALRNSPPESIEARDPEGCLAYGVALAVATGDRTAAVSGLGDPEKVQKCEKILGMPLGAGIPVP